MSKDKNRLDKKGFEIEDLDLEALELEDSGVEELEVGDIDIGDFGDKAIDEEDDPDIEIINEEYVRDTEPKKKRTKYTLQWVLLVVALAIIAFIVIRVAIWNKGKDSDYNPDENNTEFDVEPSDYIQPLSAEQLAGKVDDGVTTILTIGNSPFADNYANNNLADAIGKAYDATVINVGIEESYIAQKNGDYTGENLEDGVSLYQMAAAINSGDFSILKTAATSMSADAEAAVKKLEETDMSKVDMIVIMYNLEDYREHRPLGSSDNEDINCIYGAIYKSVGLIQEKYPYIRIVMLSQPAAGVTIDDFYVDGDKQNIGQGTLSDYVTFELQAIASRGASFVDIYYGAINVDNRDKYLVNDFHINDDGAKAIAARMKKLISL